MTSEEGIFAIGDVTNNGADIAITAIAKRTKPRM
jgi:thioredoxin reductase